MLRANPSLELEYDPQLVRKLGVGALCLSAALPVAARPYKDKAKPPARRAVEYWCEGLLPEGETRTLLEQRFGVRRGDVMGLLEAIGIDCAGAVSFVGETTPPASQQDGRLDAEQLALAVEALPSRPLGVDEDVRASLGGLQAKLLLTRTDTGWSRPVGGHPSTHILKPDALGLTRPGLVAAEALSLRAATLAGIEAAQVELVEVGGRLAVIVERYDRYRAADGSIARLHQEDGCQALGLDPTYAAKYQSTGGGSPSYAALARLLTTHAVKPPDELVRLGQQMVLSWALGNTDGHARNYSILITNGVARLAPAYDVAPTHLFAASTKMSLWIDGQAELRWITRDHLAREMTAWGVPPSDAADVVSATLARLAETVPAAAQELGVLVPASIVDDTMQHLAQVRTAASS